MANAHLNPPLKAKLGHVTYHIRRKRRQPDRVAGFRFRRAGPCDPCFDGFIVKISRAGKGYGPCLERFRAVQGGAKRRTELRGLSLLQQPQRTVRDPLRRRRYRVV